MISLFNQLHTTASSNFSSSSDHSRIQIQFQAILLNLDNDENTLESGKEYFISAGAEHGELVMVGQAKISTVLIPKVSSNSACSVHFVQAIYSGL